MLKCVPVFLPGASYVDHTSRFSGSFHVHRLADSVHGDRQEPCDTRVNGHTASEKIRRPWQIGLPRFPDA